MRRRHKLLAAASLLAPAACSAPAAHRGSTTTATPTAEPSPDATVAQATTSTGPAPSPEGTTGYTAAAPSPAPGPTVPSGPTTTVTVTIPATTTAPRTTTTFVLPERRDEDLSDEEWWATQPGFVPGACGGSLPPCWVMRRESGGDPTAVNATGCGGRGCYGKWQFDPRTSRGLGYAKTMDQYPESVQDDAARALWAGGRGCSHWGAC